MTLFDSSTEAAISSLQTMIDRVQVGQQRLRDQDDRFSRRYRDNMNLFAAVMPHIYDEFKDYQPKNRAVFVEACSDLNLYDASQNLTLFTREPRKRAHVQFEQFKSKPLKTFLTFGRQQVHPSRHVHFGNQYVEKWYEAQEAYPEKSPLPHFVPSMVMFGLEFGYQLECLLAGHEVKHLYIYEPELDFFYYSLFAIDWQPILEHFNCDGRTINFLLGVQAKDITDKYLVQLEENGFFWAPETYIYIAYKTPTLDESVRAFQSSYARQASGWGFFDDALIGIAQGMRSLPNMTLCVMNSEKKLPRWQQDIPVFILGNGPSLDDGVELLKEVRDQVILISCGSTINTLRRMGIKPDFQVDVERMKQTVDKFVFFEKQELSDVVGLTVDVMHPDFYQYFDRTITGGKPGEAVATIIGTALAKEGVEYGQMNYSGPFVANLALSYCHYFGFRNIYFLGVDNGYLDEENHHSKYSGYYKDGKESGFQSFKGANTISFPGNFGGTVYSTNEMMMSRVQLEALLNRMRKHGGFYCYNLSRGAKIEGADPLPVDDVMITDSTFDKEIVVRSIYDTFTRSAPESLINETPESVLHLEHFLEALDYLKQGWDDRIQTREDLCQLLWRYHRTLYLMKATDRRVIYDLLKGSYTAAAYQMLSIAFMVPDEAEAITRAREVYDIWCQYMNEMPDMVRQASSFIDEGDEHLIRNYNG